MSFMKYSPLMTVSQFAENVGVSEGVVVGWIKREYIPTHKIGRHRLVNIAQLNHKALFNVLPSSYDQELENHKRIEDVKKKTSLDAIEDIRSEFLSANRATRKALLKKHGDENAVVGKLYIESLGG